MAPTTQRPATEYTGTNGTVGATSTYAGHFIDTSAASGGGNTSVILAEVCKQVTAGHIVPDPSGNGYYPVYTDVQRGNAGYCAWHSAGSCGGKALQFAFFFNLDGDAGCDPADTTTGHSQGLAAIANVSGHELSEARSDPANPGSVVRLQWSGKWRQVRLDVQCPVRHLHQRNQMEDTGRVVERGYTAGTGYPNSSGQKGCLDGH